MEIINNSSFEKALKYLSKNDKDIKEILKNFGKPKLFVRNNEFATIIKIIVEQMLSVSAANSIFSRLEKISGGITPEFILDSDTETLREIGLSYQKIKYCKNISQAVKDNLINLHNFEIMTNEEIFKKLILIKGIGEWTANIYLLSALQRIDIWPIGDHALAMAVQKHKNLIEYPTKKIMKEIGNLYAPYRTIAALIFWHTYN